MRFKSIIKKLNKTYSIVIIPNSNDSIKKFSLKAPFIKILLSFLVITTISLTITLVITSSKATQTNISKDANTEESSEVLTQKVQELTQIIVKQNETLSSSEIQIQELKTSEKDNKYKINEFTKMYSEIANNYVSKSSRASVSKNSNRSALDLLELSKIVEQLNKSFTVDEQLSSELEATNEKLKKYVDTLPTFVPASGKITSPFGMRNHPISKVNKVHQGVDIDAQKGDPILAAGSGVVEFSGYSTGYGYNVIINHNNGFRTIYGHSSKLLVKEGDVVKKGQKIALVGSTGASTGPHLHFEIRLGNTPVDPTNYVDFSS